MKKPFVLASRSPRRKQLLEAIGLDFIIDPPDIFDEMQVESESAHEIVLTNAIGKAQEVAERHKDAFILGVDTVGAYKDHILEKPHDHAHAFEMLKLLSGTTHQVLSGLCVIDTGSGTQKTAVESTNITFLELSDKDIENYLKKDESMDKAAAYAAQGLGSLFVKRFDGDYFNVVGLPMARFNVLMREFGVDLMDLD